MEESNAWRNPIDLVAILEQAFAQMPDGAGRRRGASAALGTAATA